MHVENVVTLLHKRVITKEILFCYLHYKEVPINNDFTKVNLIQKVVNLWNSTDVQLNVTEPSSKEAPTKDVECNNSGDYNFPVHTLARQFAQWFFENYNSHSLKHNDFCLDAKLNVSILANDGCNTHEGEDAISSIQILDEVRETYHFLYNPNLNISGVQGRMDVYGLVVILSCGTLHNLQGNFLGLFECAFRILRDPLADNNWKIKNIKLVVRSSSQPSIPSLTNSPSLSDGLALPVPTGELM